MKSVKSALFLSCGGKGLVMKDGIIYHMNNVTDRNRVPVSGAIRTVWVYEIHLNAVFLMLYL